MSWKPFARKSRSDIAACCVPFFFSRATEPLCDRARVPVFPRNIVGQLMGFRSDHARDRVALQFIAGNRSWSLILPTIHCGQTSSNLPTIMVFEPAGLRRLLRRMARFLGLLPFTTGSLGPLNPNIYS